MNTVDNITAPATGIGGAVAILRVSGPEALAIGNRVWCGARPLSREVRRQMLLGRVGVDAALAVYMPGPHSYTGDDVVELHCHGGQAAADQALRLLLSSGCRMAEPGEFTFRAFANGKLDLAQAEAVQDVISAGSALALKVAENQLAGVLSRQLDAIYGSLSDLRAECESRLDFPDEVLDWDETLPSQLRDIIAELETIYDTRDIGGALRDGIRVVLAGRPNAGKSSLLNRLLGYERAIVTEIPGTTRDTVEAAAVLRGLPVHLTDTAGLRETADPIERIGVERSRKSLASAGVTFWVLDAAADPAAELAELEAAAPPDCIAVWNKCDLAPGFVPPPTGSAVAAVAVSALSGAGMEELLDAFAQLAAASPRPAVPEVAVNARAAGLLEQALAALPEAGAHFEAGDFELAAAAIRRAMLRVGEITGKTVEPDILDHIFSRFCIGK